MNVAPLLKNWKTTVLGILVLVSGLAPIWAPPTTAQKIQLSVSIFTASGLLVAKDADKSGS